MARTKPIRNFVLAFSVWVAVFLLSLKLGAMPDTTFEILSQIRLPRAILASAVGMGLAVAGAALQSIFSNPLCEPYTLGISSGSALGAVLGVALGLQWNFAGLAGTAFIGALIFAAVLDRISARAGSSNLTLLLAGVMLGFLGSSLVAVWMALADVNGIQGALFWLLGDLSRARLGGSILTWFVCFGLVFAIWTKWRDLDVLMMGEEDAMVLGVHVKPVRRKLIILVSFLIAVCVSGGGMIGFVGLVVPHFVRRFAGSSNIVLLPLCAVWGGISLVIGDSIARSAFQPYELPVGVVAALVGAPLFLWIMLQRKARV